MPRAVASSALVILALAGVTTGAQRGLPPLIAANDNLAAAGRIAGNTLTVTLEARMGAWYPDQDRRSEALRVAAFGEPGRAPTIPGPLIRVRSGTTIRVRIVNRLDKPLTMHGLHTHPVTIDDTVQVGPGTAREVAFPAGAAGTYFYWASTAGEPIEVRHGGDSQLSGALVVDPARGVVPADRIFVLGLYDPTDPDAPADTPAAPFATAINGRSWPYTERISATVGDSVRWRWINATNDNHPMHLHGFYYRVDRRGTSMADSTYGPDRQREVVTERMDEGTTMTMTWSPERAGQWLMHCHIHFHIAPDASWGADYPRIRDSTAHGSGPHAGHEMDDMAGLVLGVNVTARANTAAGETQTARQLRLVVEQAPVAPRIRVGLEEAGSPLATASSPGTPLVLTRGEPAAITVVNHLTEPTAIHWHGIELDSYYDGVPGWSGTATRLAPMIAPGDSFVARMAPPRSGTFIYHAHNLATKQVGNGLVGALVVVEPGEVRDPAEEIIWIVGGNDIFFTGFLELNGAPHPRPLVLAAGRRYLVRIINITESNTGDVSLGDSTGLATWRPLAKDAMPLSAARQVPVPADVRTSVGETFDFEFESGAPRQLTLRVMNGGKTMASQLVEIR
jgi:FtsP/CotA-like multicopper oxidase with cupredoxin domain